MTPTTVPIVHVDGLRFAYRGSDFGPKNIGHKESLPQYSHVHHQGAGASLLNLPFEKVGFGALGVKSADDQDCETH